MSVKARQGHAVPHARLRLRAVALPVQVGRRRYRAGGAEGMRALQRGRARRNAEGRQGAVELCDGMNHHAALKDAYKQYAEGEVAGAVYAGFRRPGAAESIRVRLHRDRTAPTSASRCVLLRPNARSRRCLSDWFGRVEAELPRMVSGKLDLQRRRPSGRPAATWRGHARRPSRATSYKNSSAPKTRPPTANTTWPSIVHLALARVIGAPKASRHCCSSCPVHGRGRWLRRRTTS